MIRLIKIAIALLLLSVPATAVASEQSIIVLCRSHLTSGLHDDIQIFLADLNDAGYQTRLISFDPTNFEDLRLYLRAKVKNETGVILIGEFPYGYVVRTRVGVKAYVAISDHMLMDLDGKWTKGSFEGYPTYKYLKQNEDKYLDIWVSRIQAPQSRATTTLDEVGIIRKYLSKNHSYRTGKLKYKKRTQFLYDKIYASLFTEKEKTLVYPSVFYSKNKRFNQTRLSNAKETLKLLQKSCEITYLGTADDNFGGLSINNKQSISAQDIIKNGFKSQIVLMQSDFTGALFTWDVSKRDTFGLWAIMADKSTVLCALCNTFENQDISINSRLLESLGENYSVGESFLRAQDYIYRLWTDRSEIILGDASIQKFWPGDYNLDVDIETYDSTVNKGFIDFRIIVTKDGKPVKNADVQLFRISVQGSRPGIVTDPPTGTTDKDGVAVLIADIYPDLYKEQYFDVYVRAKKGIGKQRLFYTKK